MIIVNLTGEWMGPASYQQSLHTVEPLSGYDSPEQLAYEALAWKGQSAGPDTEFDCEAWTTAPTRAGGLGLQALEDGLPGSRVNWFVVFSLCCVTPGDTSEARTDRAKIIIGVNFNWLQKRFVALVQGSSAFCHNLRPLCQHLLVVGGGLSSAASQVSLEGEGKGASEGFKRHAQVTW